MVEEMTRSAFEGSIVLSGYEIGDWVINKKEALVGIVGGTEFVQQAEFVFVNWSNGCNGLIHPDLIERTSAQGYYESILSFAEKNLNMTKDAVWFMHMPIANGKDKMSFEVLTALETKLLGMLPVKTEPDEVWESIENAPGVTVGVDLAADPFDAFAAFDTPEPEPTFQEIAQVVAQEAEKAAEAREEAPKQAVDTTGIEVNSVSSVQPECTDAQPQWSREATDSVREYIQSLHEYIADLERKNRIHEHVIRDWELAQKYKERELFMSLRDKYICAIASGLALPTEQDEYNAQRIVKLADMLLAIARPEQAPLGSLPPPEEKPKEKKGGKSKAKKGESENVEQQQDG